MHPLRLSRRDFNFSTTVKEMITDLTTTYFNALENNIRERFPIDVVNVLETLDPPGMRRRSDVSFGLI